MGGRLGEEAEGNVRTYRIVLYYCVAFLDRWVCSVFFFLFSVPPDGLYSRAVVVRERCESERIYTLGGGKECKEK